jgi:glutathione synthase/RimK-type ligase-like ATP-grasp enzyme
VANAARLAGLTDVVAPAARFVGRASPAPNTFPFVLRVPGMHMGRGMIRIDDASAFAQAIATTPPRDERIAIDYVDTRSRDGAWRKYRVMTIDGSLYPLHLAISNRWDVHYFSAAMADRPDYRAEEARFLADPQGTLGARAWDALGRVRDTLGLEYAGIDFALTGDGRIVVFEANAAMTALRPDPDARFAYRGPASEALAGALEQMFRRRIA